jgi:hypothetical protein
LNCLTKSWKLQRQVPPLLAFPCASFLGSDGVLVQG